MFLINREGKMVNGVEETIQSSFNFRGVGDFPFDGWTSHLGVIISGLVGERAKESSLQTSIGGHKKHDREGHDADCWEVSER